MRYKRLSDCPDGLRKLLVNQYGPDPIGAPIGRRTKYGNVRTEFCGEVFDSKAEASDDQTLRTLEAAGEIAGYARQVSIPLRARKRKRMQIDWLINEKRPHACTACGHVDRILMLVLKDTKTKGTLTTAWQTKRHILEAQLGVTIELIEH